MNKCIMQILQNACHLNKLTELIFVKLHTHTTYEKYLGISHYYTELLQELLDLTDSEHE